MSCRDATLRLFCFPYAGGGASLFRDWAPHFADGIEVCPVELPGRGVRFTETPHAELGALVAAVAEELIPVLDGPFAFYGHSLGALVSFELARLLRTQRAEKPLLLVVSACRAPQMPGPTPPSWNLPDHEFMEALRRLGGTPDEVLECPELMEVLLPAIRADYAADETYRYRAEPPLACPILVFGGKRDITVDAGDLVAWRTQTTRTCRVQWFEGDHFFDRENLPEVIAGISSALP